MTLSIISARGGRGRDESVVLVGFFQGLGVEVAAALSVLYKLNMSYC